MVVEGYEPLSIVSLLIDIFGSHFHSLPPKLLFSSFKGAFLAGCTFSQIEHAHHTFMEKTHQLMTWLLRVFFAASIGFQVPVKQFGDPYVIGWVSEILVCFASLRSYSNIPFNHTAGASFFTSVLLQSYRLDSTCLNSRI